MTLHFSIHTAVADGLPSAVNQDVVYLFLGVPIIGKPRKPVDVLPVVPGACNSQIGAGAETDESACIVVRHTTTMRTDNVRMS